MRIPLRNFFHVTNSVSLVCPPTAKVRAHELRNKTKSELLEQLNELKTELAGLRVAQVTNGAPAKLAKIYDVRKNIARVLTVANQTAKSKLREKFAGQKHIPVDLREKKTRAIRRRLTSEQANKKTARKLRQLKAYPARVFAVKNL